MLRCNWISPATALAVSNTCNRMSGGFALEGATLTLSPVASTMMACTDPKLAALDAEVGKRQPARWHWPPLPATPRNWS